MKKVLYICHQDPASTNSAGRQRNNLLCRALAEVAALDVVCFAPEASDLDLPNCTYTCLDPDSGGSAAPESRFSRAARFISNLFSVEILGRRNPYLVQKVSEFVNRNDYDYIVVCYIFNAIKCGIKLDKKVIVDIDDLPEQKFLTTLVNKGNGNSLTGILRLWFQKLYSLRLRYYTRKVAGKVRRVVMSNKFQRDLFSNGAFMPGIPYPFREKARVSAAAAAHDILFVGTLYSEHNIRGLTYFLEKIWHQVREQIPDARLNIVGTTSPTSKKHEEYWKTFPGVNLKGFCEDIASEYAQNAVVIAPIYHGAGINVKVLEALYYERPMVITDHAARGFEDFLRDGENIMIAATDDAFVRKLVALVQDSTLLNKITENTKNVLNSEYSWEYVRKTAQSLIQ